MSKELEIISHIRSCMQTLGPAEKLVANLVIGDPNAAIHLSTASIAKKAGVSEPTIIRFCKAIGCVGFADFKLKLAQELGQQRFAGEIEISATDETEIYTAKVLEMARSGIGRMARTLNSKSVKDSVEKLVQAKKISFMGLGASAPVVMDASYKFVKLNSSVSVFTDDWSQRMAVNGAAQGDVFVIVSYTGRTINIINVARLARKAGATVIGITREKSPLAVECDHVLPVEAPEEHQDFLPRHSRLVHFAAVEVLAAGYILKMGPAFRKKLNQIQQSLEETRIPPNS